MSNKISLIIAREYNQRVRKKSFIITTILMPVLMVALMTLPALLAVYGGSGDNLRQIVVIDQSGAKIGDSLASDENVSFTLTNENYEQAEKEYGNAFGFLIIGENIVTDPSQLKLYTRQSSTMGIENYITRQISSLVEAQRIAQANIPGLDSLIQSVKARASLTTFVIDQKSGGEKSSSSALSMGLGYFGGFMIYMFVFLYGGMVLQGVIEEKNNRIVEVIVSSVKPFQLMMGKILGIAAVALTQLVVWIVLFVGISIVVKGILLGGVEAQSADITQAAATAGISPNVTSLLQTLGDPSYMMMIFGCYILFFVGGYLLYAAMFAAVGSAVDNIQDAQQLQLPITIPLILSIIVLMNAIQHPESGIAFWFSIIPFTSPIVMMARIPYGIAAWEIIMSLVILYGSFICMTWVSAKIYRTGIFMYGKKPSLKEIIKWVKYN